MTANTPYVSSTGVSGEGWVGCYDEYMGRYAGDFSASTWIVDDDRGITVAQDQCLSCHQMTWVGGPSASFLTRGDCYRGRTNASSTFDSNEVGSSAACDHVDPPPPIGDQCGGNTDFTSACSPILINFERGPYRLTGAESPVLFDISASGTPIRIGWTAADADEAFLWLDRDHDGIVDSGAELFGTATPLHDGHTASNGFIALREFDDDADRRIDSTDAIWSRLLLWRDRNHDGHTQPDEIGPVDGSGIVAISLDEHWTGRRDASGNGFRYQSTIWITRGANRAVPEPVYDVFFVAAP